MLKKLILFFLLFTLSILNSQTNKKDSLSILIYYEGQGFLQPYIEKAIKDLTNKYTNEAYFFSVNSFNRFINDNKYQAELNELINSQKPENVQLSLYYSNSEKEIRERIYAILKDYKYFLTVKTNTLGELLEFQFQLFETITSNENIPYNIADKVKGVENFFVNPKDPDYQQLIENAIKRLFTSSNHKPNAVLRVFNKEIKSYDTIRVPLYSKVEFDGGSSGDLDSEHIYYMWRNVLNKDEEYQTKNIISFLPNQLSQKIKINKHDHYKVGFKVYDGIQYSDEIILNILTKETKPNIILFDTIIYTKKIKPVIIKQIIRNYSGILYFKNNKNSQINNNDIILLNEQVPLQHLNKVNKNIISPISINNEKDNLGSNYIIINTEATEDFTNLEKNYYLYSIDKDSLVNYETKIKHKLINRNSFNFRVDYDFISTSLIDISNPIAGYFSSHPTLSIGLQLKENIEISFSIPFLKSEKITLDELIVYYPYNFNLKLSYVRQRPDTFYYSRIDPILGIESKSFYSENITTQERKLFFSMGGHGGVEYNIINNSGFEIALRMLTGGGVFIKSELDNDFYVRFSFGGILRI